MPETNLTRSSPPTLLTATSRNPPSSYLHLTLHPSSSTPLDPLQVRSLLTNALTRFLGATGAAVPVDVLKVDGADAWVRVPREDLPAVSAAVAFMEGERGARESLWLRVKNAGDWLGEVVGREEQEEVWG